MANPSRDHQMAVKWILRYLTGTQNVSLCFGHMKSQCIGFVDIGFAGDKDRRRSTTCYIFTMLEGAISQELKLQSVRALSTTQAKYMVTTHACKEAIWLQRLFEELMMKQHEVIYVNSDSQVLFIWLETQLSILI